jgi:SAM-dependent methyltransferase
MTWTLLHRDDGLVDTRVPGEKLADLEVQVSNQFLTTPGRLLDLGCGKGRASVYFAEKGYQAVGVDIDLDTLRAAKRLASEIRPNSCDFILADGCSLCFRGSVFDCVICFGSTLSEKFRVWLRRKDRESIVCESLRVANCKGMLIFNFVHRYWSVWGFIKFLRYYWAWGWKRLVGERIEFGDYWESIGTTKVWFHGFTIPEAKSLFPPKGMRLQIWKRNARLFTDWFFVIVNKVAA